MANYLNTTKNTAPNSTYQIIVFFIEDYEFAIYKHNNLSSLFELAFIDLLEYFGRDTDEYRVDFHTETTPGALTQLFDVSLRNADLEEYLSWKLNEVAIPATQDISLQLEGLVEAYISLQFMSNIRGGINTDSSFLKFLKSLLIREALSGKYEFASLYKEKLERLTSCIQSGVNKYKFKRNILQEANEFFGTQFDLTKELEKNSTKQDLGIASQLSISHYSPNATQDKTVETSIKIKPSLSESLTTINDSSS